MTTLLLIDDDPATLEILSVCLNPHYRTRIATSGARGLELAALSPPPDLVLLDIELPDLSGHEVYSALKRYEHTAGIPVIFLSSHSAIADITLGLELGAVDFVTKPVAPAILLARVRTQLRLRESQIELAHRNLDLESLVRDRTRDLQAKTEDLQRNQELTIGALGAVAETRDNETGNHIHRTRAYVRLLVEDLVREPARAAEMSSESWSLIWKCAPLHDIGKVGIPDHILLKPGKLDADEFEIMKSHTTLGRQAFAAAQSRAGTENPFLRIATDIAYSHHERWDGKGYPEGFSGTSIPMPARLMAVADVYDALITQRVYKPAMSHAEAAAIVVDGSGTHFDPAVVASFIHCADAFDEIASRFADPSPERSPS